MFLVAPKADVRIADSGPNLGPPTSRPTSKSPARPAHVSGEMRLPPRDGPVNGLIKVSHLDIAALGRNAKMFDFLRSVGMLADFSAGFAVDGTHLLNARFSPLRPPARLRSWASRTPSMSPCCTSPGATTALRRA